MKRIKRDGELYWIEKDCFIHRIKNDYVPEGEKPFWQYWIWKITGRCQPNKLIGATESLKTAKLLFKES